ncbi:MAG TPA: NAD-dependent epimerase/dehydratase family protein [Gaiellaceae bacterium]|nr:NAD-dependent epimerase/dehydratase family protein [Gaiellaceae bacterium]
MRILVTGGAGFIGSHLVEQLTDYDVHVLDDLSRGSRDWLPADATLHEVDLRDADGVARAVASVRPDVVAHLAALHFIPAVDRAPELAREINVGGTENLLRALREHVPQLVLLASSAAVYPDSAGPIPEATSPEPIDVYGRTKLEGERLVERFGEETGTGYVLARLFNIIGRRETNRHVVPELIDQLREGASPVRLGNLAPRRDYTDVVDAAAALALLLLRPATETVFNVGSGKSTSVAELVAACERILGRPIPVEPASERLRARDRAELLADIGRLASTGWSPTRTLEQTLATLLDE